MHVARDARRRRAVLRCVGAHFVDCGRVDRGREAHGDEARHAGPCCENDDPPGGLLAPRLGRRRGVGGSEARRVARVEAVHDAGDVVGEGTQVFEQAGERLELAHLYAVAVDDVAQHVGRARTFGRRHGDDAERRQRADAEPERAGAGLSLRRDGHAGVDGQREAAPAAQHAHEPVDADAHAVRVVGVAHERVQPSLVVAGDLAELAACVEPRAPRRVGLGVEDGGFLGVEALAKEAHELVREPLRVVRAHVAAESERELHDVRVGGPVGTELQPDERAQPALRRVEVQLIEEVFEVVAERDDWLPPDEGRRLQNGVCHHHEAHGRFPFPRQSATAVDKAGRVCDRVERPHEHAEAVAQGLARLAGVLGAARPVLEPSLDHALRLHAARELAESEYDVFVVEPSEMRGRSVDGAKVAFADEPAELFRAALDAEREREQVREHDDLELGVEAEHEPVDEHAAECLVVAVLERRVEERRVERGAGRRREVDGGEVRPELVDEHVLQVPDDVARLG